MSNTYLVGYYGMQNSGDDALLLATAWGARRFLNAEQLTLNSPVALKVQGQGEFAPLLRAEQQFPAQNRLRQYRAAVNASRVIFGGGSVFHNARDINIKRHLMALAGSREHLALGVGLGPFVDTRAERACAKFLNECHFVGVRDPQSKAIAEAIAPKANVELTFDLAPSLLQMPEFSVQQLPRKGIAVCLCPKERLQGQPEAEAARIAALAKTLDLVHFFTGETIYFVDFNGHATLGDRQIHAEVAVQMNERTPVTFVDYDANPLRVMQRMAGFRVALCMRLHAAVMAFMGHTPVISLNYHCKSAGWCEQIGIPQQYRLDTRNICANTLTDLLCQGFADGFSEPTMSPDTATQLSMNNWSKLYDYRHKNSICHYSAV